jgi:hypothetical protein
MVMCLTICYWPDLDSDDVVKSSLALSDDTAIRISHLYTTGSGVSAVCGRASHSGSADRNGTAGSPASDTGIAHGREGAANTGFGAGDWSEHEPIFLVRKQSARRKRSGDN